MSYPVHSLSVRLSTLVPFTMMITSLRQLRTLRATQINYYHCLPVPSDSTMSFAGLSTVRKILAKIPRGKIQELQGDIFGQIPILNVRTGAKELRRPNTGVYIKRYYIESIDKAARLVSRL